MHRTLSCRELEILSLVMQGKTSKEIATLVKLRVETVRSYRKAMMKKLEVNNVAGLVRFAFQTGLMRLPVDRFWAAGKS
jgi:DNA-binding NarL/FixJ family response regulator